MGARPSWIFDPEVRRRVEAYLPTVHRDSLDQLMEDIGLERDGWMEVPTLRTTFASAAAWQIVRDEQAIGESQESAIITTSVRLGIPDGTVRSWITRWRSAA